MNDFTETATAGISTGKLEQAKRPSASRALLILPFAAYLLLALALLPDYMTFYNKDEIAYVAIAERYARGDFATAPNSMWGPLISWLMALPMSIGISSIIAARTTQILVGAATLWSVGRLAKAMTLRDRLRLVFMLTLIPYILYFALYTARADLVLTGLLVLYFAVIVDPDYPNRQYSGVLCGFLGGFAYYAKGYALGFFLVHFVTCSALHWIAHSEPGIRKKVARHMAAGLAVLAALVSIWTAVLYQKYGVLTVGVTGSYNYQIAGPGAKARPSLSMGFAEPPKSTTVSIWEDPAYFYALPEARDCCLKTWTPFDSFQAFRHQVRKLKSNLGRTLLALISFSPFTLPVGFAALAYCFVPWWPSNQRRAKPRPDTSKRKRAALYLAEVQTLLAKNQRLMPLLMLLTVVLYATPYMLIWSDERYLWPALIILMGLGFFLLDRFVTTYQLKPTAGQWLIGIFAASFLLYPIYKLSTGLKARESYAFFVRQLRGSEVTGAKFASNTDYGASMVVGYYLKAKYYGQAIPGMSETEIAESLKRKHVQYYFVWGLPATPRPGMTLSRVVKGEFRTLAIYKVDS